MYLPTIAILTTALRESHFSASLVRHPAHHKAEGLLPPEVSLAHHSITGCSESRTCSFSSLLHVQRNGFEDLIQLYPRSGTMPVRSMLS